jgi:hypothetical protein
MQGPHNRMTLSTIVCSAEMLTVGSPLSINAEVESTTEMAFGNQIMVQDKNSWTNPAQY